MEDRMIPEECQENAIMNCYRILDNPERIELKNNTKSTYCFLLKNGPLVDVGFVATTWHHKMAMEWV